MARYRGPQWKKARRLGFSITETGKELVKRQTPPGQHGNARRRKLSSYGLQLQEKQKVRYMYGLNEKQFRILFDKAKKIKGVQGVNFLLLLESRLDNVVYRLGLSSSRRGARQLVNHGHVLVDGKRVDIPSYLLKPGQKISLREKSQNHPAVVAALELVTSRKEFVTFEEDKKEGVFVRYPERAELNQEVQENLIVEFYNR
jgi:small subunit ribosomal protein S4